MFQRRGRGGGRDAWAMMMLMRLAMQIYELEDKPPVTVAAIALQAALHFGVVPGSRRHTLMGNTCLQPDAAFAAGLLSPYTLSTAFWATLTHLSDYHLAVNMASFLWKGLQLERRMGSGAYLWMLLTLALGTAAATLALATAGEAVGITSWMSDCAAGFSGVLFALKVVLTHDAAGTSAVAHGMFSVPTRYLAWAELLIMPIMVPNTSFVSHLGGIVAGAAYVAAERAGVVAAVHRALSQAMALVVEALGPGQAGAGGGPQPPRQQHRPAPHPTAPAYEQPAGYGGAGGTRGAPRTYGGGVLGGAAAGMPGTGGVYAEREGLRQRWAADAAARGAGGGGGGY